MWGRPTQRHAGQSFGRRGTFVRILDVGQRSIDFGLADKRLILVRETSGVQSVRSSLWRAGAVVSGSRPPHWPVLAGIEAAYIARWVAPRFRRG
jgi:hypothetical protein